MKVFIASYHCSFGFGGYQEYKDVVIAETEAVALGLVLESHPETAKYDWCFEEISLTEAKAHYVSACCS